MRYVSFNVPYFVDFFAATDDVIRGRWLIDFDTHPGGFTLFVGKRFHVVVDIHALRAVHGLNGARAA